jgi:hypothetical protein
MEAETKSIGVLLAQRSDGKHVGSFLCLPMKQKETNSMKSKLAHYGHRLHGHVRRHKKHHAISFIALAFVVGSVMWIRAQNSRAAGIDDVTVALSNEAVNTASTVTVVFTFGTLVNGNTIKIYVGDTTGGSPWQQNSITTSDISCSDNGTGESYTVDSITAAGASVPMWTQITATTVGSGASVVTCVLGDGSPNPKNPTAAGNYSVSVVTTNDSGAGIAYVGSANDIVTSATALPNLTLTIDGADATACVTTSGVTACNLGTVTTGAVNTGYYDVNVGTNATNGATMKIAEDGNLRNGSDDINDVIENNTVTLGTETYGVAVASDASWTEQGDFTDDDTPIPTGPANVATTSSPIASSGDDVTVTHRVAVSSATKALTYSHIVTWTATANF